MKRLNEKKNGIVHHVNHVNQSFTFTIFSDGISVCKKSNITIWPILLVINKLPIERRFCVDHVIIAGKLLLKLQNIIIAYKVPKNGCLRNLSSE